MACIDQIRLDFTNSSFICLGLSESWLHELVDTNLVKLVGFHECRLDRATKKRGGGLITFIRKDIEWFQLGSEYNVSTENIEVLSIVLIRKGIKKMCVTSLYIPPKANIGSAIEQLTIIGEKVSEENMDWVIGGDLNVNLIESNSRIQQVNCFASNMLLHQIIKRCTRKTKDSATLIDHIYVNDIEKLLSSGCIPYGVSDHDIIYVIFKKNIEKPKATEFSCRKKVNYDRNFLEYILSTLDWSAFDNSSDINHCWEIMYAYFVSSLDYIVPWTTIKTRTPQNQWATGELLSLIKKRDHLKSKLDILNPNNNNTQIELTEVKKKIKRSIVTCKRQFVKKRIDNADTCPKKYWNELHAIAPLGKKSKRQNDNIINKMVNDEGVELPYDAICDYINQYFTNIGPDLADKIQLDNDVYIENCINTERSKTNFFCTWRPTTMGEVHHLVKNLDVNKGSNIEGINSFFIKECLLCSLDKITDLYNKILITGIFPDDWKKATITPIFKTGDKYRVKNYRPISLLPVVGKIFEKIMHVRLYNYLQETNFFSPAQNGFRPKKGHTTA